MSTISTSDRVPSWVVTASAIALFAAIPYGLSLALGTADPDLQGLAALQSRAASVFCGDGLTATGGALTAGVVVLALLWGLSLWRADLLGPVTRAFRAEGAYVLTLALFIGIPFWFAWNTDSSVCERGRAFFWESIFIEIYILSILAISYNLLFGFTGVVSFGHAAFFGMGAYTVGIFMELLGFPWWLAILGALLVGLTIALVKGVVGLRIKGLYFALFTLAFAEVFFLLAGNRIMVDITGAEDGFTFAVPDWLNTTRNRLFFYYLALTMLVLAFVVVRQLMNSPTGAVLRALRDNEDRAQMLGYNTFQYKLTAIIMSGFLATGAGILRGLNLKGASPNVLSVGFTFDPLLATIVGGMGTFSGPVVGALGIHLLEHTLRDQILNIGGVEINIGERWSLILGVVFVVIVLLFPRGLMGSLQTNWLERLMRRGKRDSADAETH